jgi:ATP-dependent Clp protease ATP-binding subunit ClpA
MRAGEGRAAHVLRTSELELDDVRATIDSLLGGNERVIFQQIIPTSRVKKVIELAFARAREMGDSWVGTEHLLLGLIEEGEGIAAHILQMRGVDAAAVRATLPTDSEEEYIDHQPFSGQAQIGSEPPARSVFGHAGQYTSQARSALALAEEEADRDGAVEAGSTHLLVGLVRQAEGTAGRALLGLGVTLERVREGVARADAPSTGRAVAGSTPTSGLRYATLRARFEARRSGATEGVDTEHLLLAIQGEASVLRVLSALGLSPVMVAARLEELGRASPE